MTYVSLWQAKELEGEIYIGLVGPSLAKSYGVLIIIVCSSMFYSIL